ncbi:MAG: hypothetical protein GDYSWBUE_001582 [Candidatus Fervidibacterota bacterium]
MKLLQELLKTKWLGKSVVYIQSTGSTMDIAKELAEHGAPNGMLVIAERQTSGRGRFGRRWVSPEGGIYISLILRTPMRPEDLFKLTILSAVGVCEGLREATSLPVMVKWINDLMLCGKKVGGILVEAKSSLSAVAYAIVGIGVNVNTDVSSFPDELKGNATSLCEFVGSELPRENILASMLAKLECRYEQLLCGEFEDARQSFNRLHIAHEKLVEVRMGSHTITGHVEGVDESGGLILRLRDGNAVKVMDGTLMLLERVC